MKIEKNQKGFTIIAILFAILLTFAVIIPLYIDRIRSAKETKQKAQEQVDQIEKHVEMQVEDFEKKMQEDLNSTLE